MTNRSLRAAEPCSRELSFHGPPSPVSELARPSPLSVLLRRRRMPLPPTSQMRLLLQPSATTSLGARTLGSSGRGDKRGVCEVHPSTSPAPQSLGASANSGRAPDTPMQQLG